MLVPMDDEALETDTLKGENKSIAFKTFFFLELSVICINQELQVHPDKQEQKEKGKRFPSPPYFPKRRCFNSLNVPQIILGSWTMGFQKSKWS